MQKRRELGDYDKHLVVFDTNVIEGRYLVHLLRGEKCRVFERLRANEPSYKPAIYIKTYYEICHHAKRSSVDKKSQPSWTTAECSYPGGLDVGRNIVREFSAELVNERTYWWFNMCEEWRDLDWDEERGKVQALVMPEQRELALREVELRRRFSEWKFSLSLFCKRVWAVLESELTILNSDHVYGSQGEYHSEVFDLEQELALRRLVPSEDLEIVTAALVNRASVFVTNDNELLSQTALAVSLNWKTAFVHADRLMEAMSEDFTFRTSPKEVR